MSAFAKPEVSNDRAPGTSSDFTIGSMSTVAKPKMSNDRESGTSNDCTLAFSGATDVHEHEFTLAFSGAADVRSAKSLHEALNWPWFHCSWVLISSIAVSSAVKVSTETVVMCLTTLYASSTLMSFLGCPVIDPPEGS